MILLEPKIEKMVRKARNLFQQKNFEDAIKIYQAAEKKLEPDSNQLHLIQIEMGWCFYSAGKYENAVICLQNALSYPGLILQQQFNCLRLIGFSLAAQNLTQEALPYLQKAIQLPLSDFDKRFTIYQLGKLFFLRGEWQKAKPLVEKAFRQFNAAETEYLNTCRYYLGFIAYFEKNDAEAENHFRALIHPDLDAKTRATGYFGLTHILYEKRQFSVLIDTCEKIVALQPEFYDKETLAFFLCRSYMELKMWNELENFFNRLKDVYPQGRYAISYPFFEEAISRREIPESLKKAANTLYPS